MGKYRRFFIQFNILSKMSAKSHKTYRSEITLDSEILELRKIFKGVEDKRASNASHKLDDILMWE